ncbi:precorrin-2 dehydrogenase/sirohydrochlorin ferrochelatase family protein [Halovivax gelatinilyticus]|uniref:precorrin-2 dehydrogenase/sirohydrochlorin ferrochelatase family protein n=1 Tax=Halovivax gelatinilyticus TaxID=2961597 RepID=UPI0020CA41B3|nr:bifunctional precorrin-2 dehydrogenase/sirohydrochlorin ferrochelatase [Halovivax gelatinilyticus]
MIPLFHDFTDETVLVFGGGPVGARKARRFDAEASVIVVSPAFADADFGGADLVRARPGPDDIGAWLGRADPALVVAATDDEAVNEAIVDAASRRGLLYNHATRSGGNRDAASVVVPATVREDPVVVAIATGGRAPVLSRHLRRELETDLAGAGELARLLGELRATLKKTGISGQRRHEALESVVSDPSVWTALRTGEANARTVTEDVLDRVGVDGGDRT